MQWAIWVQSTNWKRKPPIDQIRQTFEQMNFRLHKQTFDYYNPTAANRFIAEHASAGAITLWQLAWANHWVDCRIVVEDHHAA